MLISFRISALINFSVLYVRTALIAFDLPIHQCTRLYGAYHSHCMVYVCIYVCMYVCMYVFTYVYAYVCTYVCMVYIHVYICAVQWRCGIFSLTTGLQTHSSRFCSNLQGGDTPRCCMVRLCVRLHVWKCTRLYTRLYVRVDIPHEALCVRLSLFMISCFLPGVCLKIV